MLCVRMLNKCRSFIFLHQSIDNKSGFISRFLFFFFSFFFGRRGELLIFLITRLNGFPLRFLKIISNNFSICFCSQCTRVCVEHCSLLQRETQHVHRSIITIINSDRKWWRGFGGFPTKSKINTRKAICSYGCVVRMCDTG